MGASVLTDARYQNLAEIAGADLAAGPNIRRAILAQFAAEKGGEWPPQDNNPGNVHVGAYEAAGGAALPHGVGDSGAVAYFATPADGAHGYAFYIHGYGPAGAARQAIASDDASAYITDVVGFGYGTNESAWRSLYAAAPSLPAITSGQGGGTTGSGGGGGVQGSGNLPGGGGSTPPPPSVPDPTSSLSEVYTNGVRLAEALHSTWNAAPWYSSQGLTGDHLGTVPSWPAGVNYLAGAFKDLGLRIVKYYSKAVPGAVIATPATVSEGVTDPTTLIAPLYVSIIDCANALGASVADPSWSAAQRLTPKHLGAVPSLADGAQYCAGISGSLVTFVGGTPAAGSEGTSAPGGSGSGAGAGSSGPTGSGAGAGSTSGGTTSPPPGGSGVGATGSIPGIGAPSYPPPGPPGPGTQGLFTAWGQLFDLLTVELPAQAHAIDEMIRQAGG